MWLSIPFHVWTMKKTVVLLFVLNNVSLLSADDGNNDAEIRSELVNIDGFLKLQNFYLQKNQSFLPETSEGKCKPRKASNDIGRENCKYVSKFFKRFPLIAFHYLFNSLSFTLIWQKWRWKMYVNYRYFSWSEIVDFNNHGNIFQDDMEMTILNVSTKLVSF